MLNIKITYTKILMYINLDSRYYLTSYISSYQLIRSNINNLLTL